MCVQKAQIHGINCTFDISYNPFWVLLSVIIKYDCVYILNNLIANNNYLIC